MVCCMVTKTYNIERSTVLELADLRFRILIELTVALLTSSTLFIHRPSVHRPHING